MMSPRFMTRLAAALAAALPAAALAAVYVEQGDAGTTPPIAQRVAVVGTLDAIAGRLDHAFDVDLFALAVVDPDNFSATAVPLEAGAPNLQLFLFDAWGHGVVANDDNLGSPWPSLGAGALLGREAGDYLLGVAPQDADPVGAFGELFPDAPNGICRPSGISQIDQLLRWSRDFTAIGGSYRIALTSSAGTVSPWEADFDADGDVDAGDLTRWRTGFGMAAGALHAQGDANIDGDVDGDDFLIWQRQLGSALSLPTAVRLDAAGVPEPAALVLVLFSIPCFAVWLTGRERPAVTRMPDFRANVRARMAPSHRRRFDGLMASDVLPADDVSPARRRRYVHGL